MGSPILSRWIALIAVIFFVTCSGADTNPNDGPGIPDLGSGGSAGGGSCGDFSSATLRASGYDFSASVSCASIPETDCDGEMVGDGSIPFGTYSGSTADPLFFQTAQNETLNRMQDLGTVSLESLSAASVPSSWPQDSPEIVVDRTYILKTQESDGYAAFQVQSLGGVDPGNSSTWTASVCFRYSADGTF